MRVAVVPSALALLPAYASLEDPLPEVRDASLAAVRWLLDGGEVAVLCTPSPEPSLPPAGARLARALLGSVGDTGVPAVVHPGDVPPVGCQALLVVANGTARRSERAPGHLDVRSSGFDVTIERALAAGDVRTLAALDAALGDELWCPDVHAFRALGEIAPPVEVAEVDLSADPYGVQYWVARWTCAS